MRVVIHSNKLARQFAEYRISYRRFDEAFMDTERALSSHPEIFPKVPETTLSRVKLVPFNGVPPLSIFFTFDDSTVTLHFASIIDEDEE